MRTSTTASPPIVETIFGIQFEGIAELSNAHLGLFWQQLAREKFLGSDWVTPADVPPLDPQFETFSEEEAWIQNVVRLRLTQKFSARLQIWNAARDRMVQVQNGRLHYNWLGQGGAIYPKYEQVHHEFVGIRALFARFLEKELRQPIKPNQWELTYINHMPKGGIWETPADWPNLFRLPAVLPPQLEDGLPLESFSQEWHYKIAKQQGRLHVELRPAQSETPNQKEKRSVLVLVLTARGPVPGDGSLGEVDAGLEVGHNVIRNSFLTLTSDFAQTAWGLK